MTANPSASESFLSQQLRGFVPGLEVHDSPEQRAAYAYDGTAALRAEPAAIVFPVDTAQVSGVLKFASTGAAVVATCNPGCHLQLINGLRAAGSAVRVTQPVSLLAQAYRAEKPTGGN